MVRLSSRDKIEATEHGSWWAERAKNQGMVTALGRGLAEGHCPHCAMH